MASVEEEANFLDLNEGADDILGLDTAITISKRKPVARLDAARILDEEKGVPYLARNHHKISKVMRSNDKKLLQKLKMQTFLNSKETRKLKVDNELANLSAVLGFYQTWCHQLFPKATFKDCIALLRARGATSSELSHYRKELINAEIQKSQRASGPYVAETDVHASSNVIIDHDEENQQIVAPSSDQPGVPTVDDEDDNWMMGVDAENGLFVTENTDTTSGIIPSSPKEPSHKENDNINQELVESNTASDIDDADDFDDELQLFMNKLSSTAAKKNTVDEEFPEEGDYQ